MHEMAMRIDQGTGPQSAAAPLKRANRARNKRAGRRAGFPADTESATVAVPCINDPAKDCILCSEFDECSFVDRRSSLNSIAFSLIFSVIVLAAAVLWFFLH